MEQNSHTYANGYNQKNVTYIIPDTALLCPVTTSGSIASRRLDGNDINDPFDENSVRPTDQYGDDTGTSIGRRRRLLVNADTALASGENVNEFGMVRCQLGDDFGASLISFMVRSSNLKMICVEDNFFSSSMKDQIATAGKKLAGCVTIV